MVTLIQMIFEKERTIKSLLCFLKNQPRDESDTESGHESDPEPKQDNPIAKSVEEIIQVQPHSA